MQCRHLDLERTAQPSRRSASLSRTTFAVWSPSSDEAWNIGGTIRVDGRSKL
jgi:hypothetical protein